MKHVFGASSHLVFYLCNKIVESDGINPDDCIFFFTRNYHCPDKYDKKYRNIIDTSYNVDEKKGRIFEGIHFKQTKLNIQQFDAIVDSYLKGEDFLWYSQICNNDFCSLFVTKPNCRGYYVLEDGLGSYRDYNPQTFVGWKFLLYKFFLKPIWPRCFEVKNHFITTNHPKFKECIATTDYCFPLHQQYLRCVGLPFETIDLGFEPDALVSIDPIYLWVKEKDEDAVYERLSKYILSRHYTCIAYKFHPYFFAKSNIAIKQRFEKLIKKYYGDAMIELGADISLENVLMTYHCDFYTDNSSIAIYGNAMHAKCYTYIPILRNYTDAYDAVPLIESFCIPISTIAKGDSNSQNPENDNLLNVNTLPPPPPYTLRKLIIPTVNATADQQIECLNINAELLAYIDNIITFTTPQKGIVFPIQSSCSEEFISQSFYTLCFEHTVIRCSKTILISLKRKVFKYSTAHSTMSGKAA